MASEVSTSRSTALRCYVSAVSALGVALFGWCVTRVVTVGVPVEWWMFAALTFISGRITLNVPGVEATFTVSEVFAFASVLLFGPEGRRGHAGTGFSGAGVAPPDGRRQGGL